MRNFIAVVACIGVVAPLAAQEKTRFASLDEAMQASAILAGESGPSQVTWIDDGNRYSYVARDGNKTVIRAVEPRSGADSLLFTAEGLTFPNTSTPFNYASYQWTRDSRNLVFRTNFRPLYRRSGISDFYVYRLADKSLTLAGKDARTGELSPDGSMLGMERDGDMYIRNMVSGTETRLTRDATEHRYNGHFDWVYEEEFGLAQAWKWSPDSRHLAYWQIDESKEPVIQFSDFSGRHNEWDGIRIPQPGDSNPVARIGVVDVKSGRNVWLDTGEPGETYIPRIYWTSRADTLAVLSLDRKQQQLKLFFFDVNTGGKRLVFTETSKAWIDVYDFYAGIQDMMTFPENSQQFFWISDRDGWQHVYRYDYSGKLVNQVTRGAWSVTRIEGADPATQTMYYSSTEASPLQRQLYSIRFDGTRPQRITTTRGTHAINMSPGARFFFDQWSSIDSAPHVELWATPGTLLRTLQTNDATKAWTTTHAYSAPQLQSFTTPDSARIDYSIIRPVPFDPSRKYPVIFAVYGGPGSQAVYDRWEANAQEQWLAQQGYIVVDVNNRGSNNYGSAFMKVVYKQLGRYEAYDFAETAKHLSRMAFVDAARIGIMGTSYGGYSTLMAMERYPKIFTAGVSNSGVADWSLYDTIYTERYMSLLGDNEAGYRESSAIANAAKLEGHLLMIHSMLDDNVHPQNTMQLLTAFTTAGKDVDLRIYPPGHHGAAYDFQSYQLITRATFDWMDRWLKQRGVTP